MIEDETEVEKLTKRLKKLEARLEVLEDIRVEQMENQLIRGEEWKFHQVARGFRVLREEPFTIETQRGTVIDLENSRLLKDVGEEVLG